MLMKFYRSVLPRTGQLCLFLLGSKQHVWASSLDSLLDHTEARIEQQGVYFGTASFAEPTARTQANVLALRALRVDIDAGAKKYAKDPDRAYPTQRDALAALIQFSQATRIAPSFIVSSGEGLHTYYCLEDDLEPAIWLPLATRLGELGAEHALKIDTTCTTDTARILRPVGTLHPNGKRVSILKDTGKVYGTAEITELLGVAEVPGLVQRKFDMSVNVDVASTYVGPPKSIHKIIANCPAMAEVAAARGDVPEPLWRAMLGVVKFTVEGVDAAHELSVGHPDYSPQDTEKKFDAWAKGPTSCAEFGRHSGACAGCEYRGKISGPIMVGMLTEAQVAALPPELQPAAPAPVAAPTGDPWDDFLPPNFSVTRKPCGELTVVWATTATTEDATGAKVTAAVSIPMSKTVFWLTHWGEAETEQDSAHVVVCRFDPLEKVVRSFTMKQALVANRFKLMEDLADKGIHFTTDKKAGNALDEYIRAQLLRIQMMARRPRVSGRFGVRITQNGALISAHGKYAIMPDGSIIEGMLSDELRSVEHWFPITALPPSETGEWDKSVWGDHIKPAAAKHVAFLKAHYGHKGMGKFQLSAMLGLASPFMAFVTGSYHQGLTLPANGLSVSLYSRDPGFGKTSLVLAVMLAYGNPASLVKDMSKSGATDLARMSPLSMHGTMPMAMDELGGLNETATASLISAVANGAARIRLTQKGAQHAQQPWALVNLITTNRSQRDMVAVANKESSAIQSRLLELNVESMRFDQDARAVYKDAWADVQKNCAGALGAVIEYAICRAGLAKMNTLVSACVEKASRFLNADQDARFQYRALGALLAMHILLAREGLAIYDIDEMMAEFADAHNAGVTFSAENVLPTSGIELMQILLNDLKPKTLITDTETHRGTDKTKYDIPLNARVPDTVGARHVVSMGWTYLSSSSVREWCAEMKVSERDLISDCRRGGVLIQPNRRFPTNFTTQIDLFKGTKEESTTVTRCYKVNTRMLRASVGGDWDDAANAANVVILAAKAKPGAAAPQPPMENEA